MNQSGAFAVVAVRNVVGPVHGIKAQNTRLELYSAAEGAQQLVCVVEAQPEGEGIKARVTGSDNQTHEAFGLNIDEATEAVIEKLPAEVFAAEQLRAQFSGIAADGLPLNRANGSSIHGHIFVESQTEAALAAEGSVKGLASVAGIIGLAVNAAVDYIISRKGDAARVSVTADGAGADSISWVSVLAREGSLYARTNDGDPFSAPTLNITALEDSIIRAAATEALTAIFSRAARVEVRVLREESRVGYLPVLEGNSDGGILGVQPEFPSL